MIRFPWERKVWGFVAIVEVYLVIELGVSLIE
jgi:hypothetical protein